MCNHCINFHIPCSRCNRCYTKNWCSKECLSLDWEERHQKVCHKEADNLSPTRGRSRLVPSCDVQMKWRPWRTFACMEAAENSGIIKGGAGCNEEDAKRRRVKARWTVDEVKDLGD